MEIGVYNGENAVCMIENAIKKSPPSEVEYYGFDFFSYFNKSLIEEKLLKTKCNFQLYEGNTLYTVPNAVLSMPNMDMVFIDGSKSYEVSWSDWNNSSKLMHKKTGIFIHNVDFFGISKMVEKISRDVYFVKIFKVLGEGLVAFVQKKY